jgi:hypothetical protein
MDYHIKPKIWTLNELSSFFDMLQIFSSVRRHLGFVAILNSWVWQYFFFFKVTYLSCKTNEMTHGNGLEVCD